MQNRHQRERTHAELSGKVDWGASVSLDQERQFLGLLLVRGDIFDQVGGEVQPPHFYEPLHRRIYDLVVANRSKGLSFTRERLGQLLAIDEGFAAAGGDRYLDSVVQAASIAEVEGVEPTELARSLVDLFIRREVLKACADISSSARSDGLKSGEELRGILESRLFAADLQTSTANLESMGTIAARAMAASETHGAELLPTGLAKLDDRLGKCERGDLGLLGARPSMGKSALASCWGLNAAKLQIGCIEFNGEMSPLQMARRHLSDQCYWEYHNRGPTYRDIRGGKLTDLHRTMLSEAQARLDLVPLVGMRRQGLTIPQIRNIARRQQIEWRGKGIRLGYVFVDHVGILSAGDDYLRPVEAMSKIAKGLKALAIDLDCVVVALSQLNRQLESRDDKRPTLPDLKESGALEENADWVIGVYREAYYAERETEPKKNDDRLDWQRRRSSQELQAICLKVKEGPPGTERLFADVARNAIRDEEPGVRDGFFSNSTRPEEAIE